jgi:hypothetical protein
LHGIAEDVGEFFPSGPVIFRAAVLDRDDRVFGAELFVIGDEVVGGADGFVRLFEDVGFLRFVVELAGGAFGANPPSSPTLVESPRLLSTDLRAWKISQPQRRASRNVGSPRGMTMNSWKSIGASECAPPLTMFIMGTGSTLALGPPRYL